MDYKGFVATSDKQQIAIYINEATKTQHYTTIVFEFWFFFKYCNVFWRFAPNNTKVLSPPGKKLK